MGNVLAELDEPVDAAFGPDIARRIYFVDPRIVDFELIERNGRLAAVRCETDEERPDPQIAERVQRMVTEHTRRDGLLPQKVTWSNAGSDAARDVFPELVERGLAAELGRGQVAVGEPLLALMRFLDEWMRDLAVERFAADEFRYPALIPVTTLQRCGYLESFPQYLMFAARLNSDLDTYDRFLRDYDPSVPLPKEVLDDCSRPELCLPPAVCFHAFSQRRGSRLGAAESQTLTAQGKVFRYESRYATSLERLWDFTMREVVFLGERDHVLSTRRALMDAVLELVRLLELDATCEVAHDPFFVDTASERGLAQRLLELKYELRVAVTGERDIAVGSFNFHDTFFADRFDIDRGPQRAYSGCVAVGLERFAFAFVCQHGLDPAAWPRRVRSLIESRGSRHLSVAR